MVDEDLLDAKIIQALEKLSGVDVKTLLNCGFSQGAKDHTLVAATARQKRVLLTANFRDIHERKYPPCQHGGIILIRHPRPDAKVVTARLKAFCRSSQKSLAQGHVTYLKDNGFTIHKLHREVVEGKY